MTKQHFIALADAIRDMRPIGLSEIGIAQVKQWEFMRDKLADFCRSQNPNFKRDRWLSYIAGECGPNGGAIRKATTGCGHFTGGTQTTEQLKAGRK